MVNIGEELVDRFSFIFSEILLMKSKMIYRIILHLLRIRIIEMEIIVLIRKTKVHVIFDETGSEVDMKIQLIVQLINQ